MDDPPRNDQSAPASYFAQAAREYDGWYETDRGRFVDEIETDLAFRLLPPLPGWQVLDAGCGTGNFSFKLAERGCTVTGIDVSPHMLRVALGKTDVDTPVRFSQMDICDLQLPDAAFDAIYSMAAFEFIANRQRAFEELWRVLKPGGKLLVGTIAGDSPWGKAYRRAAEEDSSSVFRHADFPTRVEIEALNQDHMLSSGECLFIPPHAPSGDFNPDREEKLESCSTGGFFCVVWEKPPAQKLSCQFSLYPLAGGGEPADAVISRTVELMRCTHPDARVNSMGTIVTADPAILGGLVTDVTTDLSARGTPFTLLCILSNVCGMPTREDGDGDGGYKA